MEFLRRIGNLTGIHSGMETTSLVLQTTAKFQDFLEDISPEEIEKLRSGESGEELKKTSFLVELVNRACRDMSGIKTK